MTGSPAINLMRRLYPLMGERRQARIRELIEQFEPLKSVDAPTLWAEAS